MQQDLGMDMDKLKPAPETIVEVNEHFLKEKPSKLLGSCRFRFGLVAFLANIVTYLHRVNLNMVIVCMIEEPEVFVPVVERERIPTFTQGLNTSVSLNQSFHGKVYDSPSVHHDLNYSRSNHWTRGVVLDQSGDNLTTNYSLQAASNITENLNINILDFQQSRFNWDKPQISLLLSSYYYGCVFTQIPGGHLAHHFGGKHVVTAFFVCSMLGTLLSPIAAQTHFMLLLAVRIVLGLASGLFTPAVYSLAFKWATSKERATLMSFIISGQPLGIVIAYMSSGFFCAFGWSTIFYVHGGLTVFMILLWLYEVHSSPEEHPRISSEEIEYLTPIIHKSTLQTVPPTPWKSLLTSGALFASTFANCTYLWSYFTVIINVPMFLKEVFGFIIAENGVFSAVPYIFCTVSMMFAGKISEGIVTKKLLDIQRTRKLLATTSLVGTAMCLIGAGHVTYELRYVAVVLVCLSCLFSGLSFGGIFPSFADFAGVFAGTAFAIGNTFGLIAVILSAQVAGLLTQNGLQTEWQNVFYISAGLNLISAIIFIVLGKAAIQPWAKLDKDTNVELEVETSDKLLNDKKL